MARIEKIFEALESPENLKVKLATYKLEGDAQRWWKVFKKAKDDNAYIDTLSWDGFREVFFSQYFPESEKAAYVREYSMIRQQEDESIIEFMTRFLRLAGFVGSAAGTSLELAKKFQWAVNYRIQSKLVNMKFSEVAEAADATKILRWSGKSIRRQSRTTIGRERVAS